jgi:hypothetical protein
MALKCASLSRAKTLARPAWQAASLTLSLIMSSSAGLAPGSVNDGAPNIAGRFTWDRISRPTGTFDGKSRRFRAVAGFVRRFCLGSSGQISLPPVHEKPTWLKRSYGISCWRN